MAQISGFENAIKLLGEKLYSSPMVFILIRELLQNSIDACRVLGGKIKIRLSESSGMLRIECHDTGCGMSAYTLENVFLVLGGSQKSIGAVGGFGIAKIAIFSSNYWMVKTCHKGIGIEISSDDMNIRPSKIRNGTMVICDIPMPNWTDIMNGIRLVQDSNYPENIKVSVFDDIHNTVSGIIRQKSTKYLRTAKSGDIHFTVSSRKSDNPRKIYRINGLYQSSDTIYEDGIKFDLLIDFDNIGFYPKDKDYPFDLSRENVKWDIRQYAQLMVQNEIRDKHSNNARLNEDKKSKTSKKLVSGYWYEKTDKSFEFCKLDKQILKVFERICQIVLESINYDTNLLACGLTDDTGMNAYHTELNGKQTVFISPNTLALISNMPDTESIKLILWHLACHELAHIEYSNHNEDFTCQEAHLANSSGKFIFNDFELGRLTRYYVANR